MLFIAEIAAQLGVTSAVATTIVNIILNAGTLITVLTVLATVLSSGANALMTIGWTAIKKTVKQLVIQKGKWAAIAW